MTRIVLSLGLMALLLAGCSGGKENPGEKEKAAGRPAVAVEVVRVVRVDIDQGIEVVGSLSPKFEAEVKAEYNGIVAEVFVNEWVPVEKGTPLARLDTREADLILQKAQAAVETARANLLQAQVTETRARREYERAIQLMEVGLITRQSLEDALTEQEAAAARVAAARAQLRAMEDEQRHSQTRSSKTLLRSPLAGVVSQRNVNVGDLAGEKVLFHIVDNRVLNLTVTVPSAEMEAVRPGQVLTFSSDALPGKVFSGQVMYLNPVVDPADRSVKVIAEVQNPAGQLKGGLFVKGRIETGRRTGVLQVPRQALLAWDVAGRSGEVFVVNGNVTHLRKVRTGALTGSFVEIPSGLSAGELVVTRGAFRVKAGDVVKVVRGEGEN